MSTDDSTGTEVKKVEVEQPVVWTPEDASRFLTSAINEAQRPLADALKNRPITTKGLYLLVGSLLAAGLIIVLLLSGQVEKAEQRAAMSQDKHEQAFAEKYEIQAQHSTLQDRLNMVNDQHEELRGHVETLRKKEEVHKKTQTDLFRFRRHNEALRSQISGLEMEKAALSRQLDALKVMMDDEPEDDMDGYYDDEGHDGEDEELVHPFDEGSAGDDLVVPEQAQPSLTTAPDNSETAIAAPVVEPVTAPAPIVTPIVVTPVETAVETPAPAVKEEVEQPVSESSSITTEAAQEKTPRPKSVLRLQEVRPAQDAPSSDTEAYSEQLEAVKNILSLVDEEVSGVAPANNEEPPGAQATETVAESMTDAGTDHFAQTSAAYGASLSQPQEKTGELLVVEEIAQTGEAVGTAKGEGEKMTPAEFVEKIDQVFGKIKETITVEP